MKNKQQLLQEIKKIFCKIGSHKWKREKDYYVCKDNFFNHDAKLCINHRSIPAREFHCTRCPKRELRIFKRETVIINL